MDYLSTYGIKFRPVPSRKHHKKPLEPKHGIIRSIFLRLKHSSPDTSISLLALRAVTISNDLYGSDIMSSFDIAKGFFKPIVENIAPILVEQELITARET